MSADLRAGGMAAAMLDQEISSARTGALANRLANTSLYRVLSQTKHLQNADAVEAYSGAAALARALEYLKVVN